MIELRHVAARLRYLASSGNPKELDHELHALARMCEDGSEEPTPSMIAAAPEMYRALEQIVQILNERGKGTDRIHRIATIALAHAAPPLPGTTQRE